MPGGSTVTALAPSKKGTGFVQPDGPHRHWHLDIAYVDSYNHARLHSALGYITPSDKLNGLEQVIFAERDRKLDEARRRRQQARQVMR